MWTVYRVRVCVCWPAEAQCWQQLYHQLQKMWWGDPHGGRGNWQRWAQGCEQGCQMLLATPSSYPVCVCVCVCCVCVCLCVCCVCVCVCVVCVCVVCVCACVCAFIFPSLYSPSYLQLRDSSLIFLSAQGSLSALHSADAKFLFIPFAFLLLRIWSVIMVFLKVYLHDHSLPFLLYHILLYATVSVLLVGLLLMDFYENWSYMCILSLVPSPQSSYFCFQCK